MLEEFWDTVEDRGDPRLEGHPMVERDDWKRRAIPIMVHGDAVPTTGVGTSSQKSFDVSSIQGVLSVGPTIAVKLYMAGVFEANKAGMATTAALWMLIVHSLHFMYLGEWPSLDVTRSFAPPRAGEALCGLFFSWCGP